MRRLVLAVVVGLVACGGRGGGGDDDDGAGDTEQACLDTADAFADAAVRCAAGTYQDSYDAFVDGVGCGDCGNIIDVRDRGDLYADCIPSFTTITCADLNAANLDASCRDQLIRQHADCSDY